MGIIISVVMMLFNDLEKAEAIFWKIYKSSIVPWMEEM